MAEQAGGTPKDAASEDDTHRKFREALERKQAKNREAHGEDHLGGRGLRESHNDKTTRQFRRKSGS